MEHVGRIITYDGFNSQYRSLALKQVGHEYCESGHSYGPAVRDFYLFHYVVDGSGTYTIAGETYMINKDTIFMIPPDVVTTYKADNNNPWSYYWIGFSGMEAKELINLTGFSSHRYVMDYEESHVDSEENLSELIHKLAIKRISFESDKIEEISSLYKVISLLRKNYENSPFIMEEKQVLNSHIRMALDYILKNYTRPITVESISTYVGIDRTQLYRLFEETYAIGPKEYIIKIRLKKAEELLLTSDLPIKSVAFSVGYLDQYLFSKIFKKYYSISPKAYREKKLNSVIM